VTCDLFGSRLSAFGFRAQVQTLGRCPEPRAQSLHAFFVSQQ
jgi:hypothetical protein